MFVEEIAIVCENVEFGAVQNYVNCECRKEIILQNDYCST